MARMVFERRDPAFKAAPGLFGVHGVEERQMGDQVPWIGQKEGLPRPRNLYHHHGTLAR